MDGILCIYHETNDVWNLEGYLQLKPGLVGSINMYLGTKLEHIQQAWSTSPSKYIKKAAKICKEYATEHLWVTDCKRGLRIHLQWAIVLNWMCLLYWDHMMHLIISLS